MSTHVSRLQHRITAADWSSLGDRTAERVALLKEFLRRSALWADRLGSESWPFFDVAALVDPDVQTPRDAVAGLAAVGYPPLVDAFTAALRFEALRDAGTPLPDLPHPFAPLVAMYELGGSFALGGTGLIDIDGAGVPRGTRSFWREQPPVTPVPEDEALG